MKIHTKSKEKSMKVSVSSSSFSIPHCHTGTTLPFLLLPLLLAMACYSGFPGVFALRGSSGLATLLRLTLATAVPVSGSACTARFFRCSRGHGLRLPRMRSSKLWCLWRKIHLRESTEEERMGHVLWSVHKLCVCILRSGWPAM